MFVLTVGLQGVGLAKQSVDELFKKLSRKAKERWRRARVLIIDESKSFMYARMPVCTK